MIEYKVSRLRSGTVYLIKFIDGEMYFTAISHWHKVIDSNRFMDLSDDFTLLEDKQDIYAYHNEVVPWLKNKVIREALYG